MFEINDHFVSLVSDHRSNISETSFIEFACATIAAEACVKTVYFAMRALSSATSTSIILRQGGLHICLLDTNTLRGKSNP